MLHKIIQKQDYKRKFFTFFLKQEVFSTLASSAGKPFQILAAAEGKARPLRVFRRDWGRIEDEKDVER